MLLWKKNPDKVRAATHLNEVMKLISSISDEAFTAETVKTAIWPYAEIQGRGDVLWPLRIALTGQERSPDPFICAAILGRTESLKRIDEAIKKIG
jgi:glutamyl/glutaminyl-tRNA synthetase